MRPTLQHHLDADAPRRCWPRGAVASVARLSARDPLRKGPRYVGPDPLEASQARSETTPRDPRRITPPGVIGDGPPEQVGRALTAASGLPSSRDASTPRLRRMSGASSWTPRESIRRECARRGRRAVVDGCITLLAGGSADPDLIVALPAVRTTGSRCGRPEVCSGTGTRSPPRSRSSSRIRLLASVRRRPGLGPGWTRRARDHVPVGHDDLGCCPR